MTFFCFRSLSLRGRVQRGFSIWTARRQNFALASKGLFSRLYLATVRFYTPKGMNGPKAVVSLEHFPNSWKF
jgi:hypothetical protein